MPKSKTKKEKQLIGSSCNTEYPHSGIFDFSNWHSTERMELYMLFYASVFDVVSFEFLFADTEPLPTRKLKRITLENPYVTHVLNYVENLTNPEGFLFSSEYSRSGRMSRQHAYRVIRGLNPKAWAHLFRHSLATEMAERGATEEELMSWFDWDRYETAHRYVKGGPKLTDKWSKRTF